MNIDHTRRLIQFKIISWVSQKHETANTCFTAWTARLLVMIAKRTNENKRKSTLKGFKKELMKNADKPVQIDNTDVPFNFILISFGNTDLKFTWEIWIYHLEISVSFVHFWIWSGKGVDAGFPSNFHVYSDGEIGVRFSDRKLVSCQIYIRRVSRQWTSFLYLI